MRIASDTCVINCRTKKRWNEQFYMPTPSDAGIAAFRVWLNKFGGGEPGWINGGSDAEAMEKLPPLDHFNRWQLHSKQCPACRKSLKLLGALEALLPKVSATLLGLTLILGSLRYVSCHIHDLTACFAECATNAVLGKVLCSIFVVLDFTHRWCRPC